MEMFEGTVHLLSIGILNTNNIIIVVWARYVNITIIIIINFL